MKSKLPSTATLCLCSAFVLSSPAPAHVLYVDMIAGSSAIESAIAVTSGTLITASVGILTDGTPGDTPGAWDLIAMDLTWGLPAPGPMATLTPVAPSMAGFLAAIAGAPIDPSTGFPIGVGAPLGSLGLAPQPFPAFLGGSLGGVAILDTGPSPTFSGVGAPGGLSLPPGTAFEMFTISWIATGAPGDSVLIDPIGVLDPFGAIPAPGSPGAGFAALGAPGIGFTNSGGTPGTVTIVPEPRTALFVLLGVSGLLIPRRRRFHP